MQIKDKAGEVIMEVDGVDLAGAYLRGAYLRGAYLRDADLTGANLRDADLTGAYMTGADLRGSYLTGAYMTGANLTGANLRGADLAGEELKSNPVFIDGLKWKVTVTDQYMSIGCQRYTHSEWAAFDDARIASMHNLALEFWKRWGSALLEECNDKAK